MEPVSFTTMSSTYVTPCDRVISRICVFVCLLLHPCCKRKTGLSNQRQSWYRCTRVGGSC